QSLALRCGTPARRVEAQLRAGQRAGLIAAPEAEQLQSTYRLLLRLHAGLRLLNDRPVEADHLGAGGQRFLLRETAMPTLADLASEMDRQMAQSAQIIDSHLVQE
ncbi:MAG: glutamine-synthetase adenylyltransferase, partial [Paracoccaceae bacterium]